MSDHRHSKKHFSPWVRSFQFGFLFALPGAALLFYACKQTPIPLPLLAGALAMLGIGGLLINNGLTRWTGKQVEQTSIKALKFPDDWTVHPNYMLDKGGDIDLYVVSPDAQGFAIEIKTIQDLVVKIPFLGLGQAQLLTPSGKKLKDDPLPQTIRNAQAVDAKPVLWLPKAKAKTVKLRNGVIIVQGGKRALFKAIGCKSVGWNLW
mgnify:FL=1|jgi:hypothetical protein